VSGHTIRLFEWDSNEFCEKVLKTVLINGAVIFVFVAGYLFQYLSDRYTYKRYLLKKFCNVIIPYLVISIPIIVYHVFVQELEHWAHPGLNEHSPIYQIFWYYITGKHLAPLWFIPMISIIYILYPVFRFIDNNETIYAYIIPIALIIAAFSHRPQAEVSIPHTLLYFGPVYLFGMFCSHYRSKFLDLVMKHQHTLVFLYITLLTIELSFYDNHGIIYVKHLFSHDKELLDINLFQKLILCLLLITGFVRYNAKLKSYRIEQFLNLAAGYSFGIYFIHYYFWIIFFRFRRVYNLNIDGNIFSVTAATVIALILCIFSIKLLKSTIGKQSRLIVGC
jgi:peptidoglycan/LPS O-acetylase OafA/YrhL